MSKQSQQTKPLSEKQLQHSAEVIEHFVRYLSSPWRIIWTNFVAGVFRGLGAVIGATVVIAAVVWLLSLFVNVPLIGKYAKKIEHTVNEYAEATNYNEEFDRLGDSLEHIESVLSNAPVTLSQDQVSNTDTDTDPEPDVTGSTTGGDGSSGRVVPAPVAQPDQSQ